MSNTNKVSVFSPPWRDIYGMQYVFGQKIEHGVNLHYELTRSGPGVSGKNELHHHSFSDVFLKSDNHYSSTPLLKNNKDSTSLMGYNATFDLIFS